MTTAPLGEPEKTSNSIEEGATAKFIVKEFIEKEKNRQKAKLLL